MMTSSPGAVSTARSASSSAALPELTATASSTPRRAASAASNAATSGPWASWPPSTTRATRSASLAVTVGRECGITEADSNVQQQPDGLKGLGVLHARLDAAEVGAGHRELEDREVLDVGLRHLGAVGLQARELAVEHLLDVGVAVGREVLRRRHLEEEEVRHVARGRHRGLGQVVVILMSVVRVVHEDHRRAHLLDYRLDPHDQLAVVRHLGVAVAAPEHLVGADERGGLLLFALPHGGVPAQRAVGGDEQIDVVAPLRVEGERAAAAILDVVRVRTDGEDVHATSLE